ncbi:MAG TPA: STAS domain-containing protein [Acidimicrobiia bacterium]|nr:STAS domain-containing protein [Acidimicrobiia bacterium]
MSSDLTIGFPPRLEALPAVRLAVRRALPPLLPDEANLYFGALTEVLVNAINAHVATETDAEIIVEVSLSRPSYVKVTDSGSGIEGESSWSGIGAGLAIARSVVPDMSISSTPRGTVVVLPYPEPPADVTGFSTNVERGGDAYVVVVAGEFDAAVVSSFERSVGDVIADPLPRAVIDLDDVTILDSSAIGALLRLRRDLARLQCELSLRSSRDYHRQIIAVTGLTDFLPFED